jgi:pentatricopeptide repeat protein
MVAFRNASNMEDEINLNTARAIIDSVYSNGLSPDVPLYNILLSTCINQSRWRKAIGILNEMQMVHNLIPLPSTFDIIIDCCRHSLEEPAIIYETLKLEGLPQEFCYKAAIVNAGNRVSTQVAVEAFYQTYKPAVISDGYVPRYPVGKKYSYPRMVKSAAESLRPKIPVRGLRSNAFSSGFNTKEYDSFANVEDFTLELPTISEEEGSNAGNEGSRISEPSAFASASLIPDEIDSTFKLDGVSKLSLSSPTSRRKDLNSTVNESTDFNAPKLKKSTEIVNNMNVSIGKDDNKESNKHTQKVKSRKWRQIKEILRNTLPAKSPAKLNTSKSTQAFEVQLSKLLMKANSHVSNMSSLTASL